MLSSKPIEEIHTLDYENYFRGFTLTHLVSYSSLDLTNVRRTTDNYISETQTPRDRQFEISETLYKELKDILREKRIIFLRTYYYN